MRDRHDEWAIPGLDDEVVVHRDEWGIPHVRATTAHDAFLGQGFVQATDRLGQLEYDRRRAHGRWAEVAGPSAVAFDVFARRCGIASAAEREAEALDPGSRAVLDAYAAGINAYLALGLPLPPDLALAEVTPEPWSSADCCAVFLVRHVVFANWQKKLWRGRLVAALGADGAARIESADRRAVPLIVPPPALVEPAPVAAEQLAAILPAMARLAETAAGSNSWALDGSRTASGLPLVAGDPHRFLEVPGVYAQCHLACDDFDAIGLAFVGVPGLPHFGHSAHVAWCVTNANGDYQDLYVEDPAACADMPTRDEVVEVRGADPVHLECHTTPRGPVVFGDPAHGAVLSLRSTALADPSTGFAVLEPMLRARDVDELDEVMRSWIDPVNNFVSADVGGNISYRTVGRIPTRDPSSAWGPVPGDDPKYDWTGIVAHDELPRLRNPDGGLIVTANQLVVEPEPPRHLGCDYARPDRALRLHARLDDLRDATVDGHGRGAPRSHDGRCGRLGAADPGSGSVGCLGAAGRRAARVLGSRDGPPSPPLRRCTSWCATRRAGSSRTTPRSSRCVRRCPTSRRGRTSRSSCACGPSARVCSRPRTVRCCVPARRGTTSSRRRWPTGSGSSGPRSATTSTPGDGERCTSPLPGTR